MIKKAFILVRNANGYPYDSLCTGLKAVGITPYPGYGVKSPKEYNEAIIITWNNYGVPKQFADRHKAQGGRHFCIENGVYFTNKFCVSENKHHYFDLNKMSDTDLEDARNLQAPFRRIAYRDGPILVFGQRGGKYAPHAMPHDWPDKIISRIRAVTDHPIIYKPHPSRQVYPAQTHYALKVVSEKTLNKTILDSAKCSFVFTSSVCAESILNGVPVFYDGPSVAVAKVCHRTTVFFTNYPNLTVPRVANIKCYYQQLNKMQWSSDELRTGKLWRILGVVDA